MKCKARYATSTSSVCLSVCLLRRWGAVVIGSEHDGTTFNPHTDPDRYNAQRYRQTDRRQYDAMQESIILRAAVRSAKYQSISADAGVKRGGLVF